jgi:hypothetical protein
MRREELIERAYEIATERERQAFRDPAQQSFEVEGAMYCPPRILVEVAGKEVYVCTLVVMDMLGAVPVHGRLNYWRMGATNRVAVAS